MHGDNPAQVTGLSPTVKLAAECVLAVLDQEAYSLVDLSVVWTAPNDKLTLGVYGKNLTDEEYRIGGYNFPGGLFANSVTAYYGPPQTVTLSLEAKF